MRLIIILFILCNISAFSQNYFNQVEALKNELSRESLEKLDIAEHKNKEADILWAEADNMYKDIQKLLMQSNYTDNKKEKRKKKKKAEKLANKANKKRIKAYDIYEASNKIRLEIYHKKLDAIRPKNDAQIANAGLKYEKDAEQLFKEAKNRRKKINKSYTDIQLNNEMKEIKLIQQSAFNILLDAFAVYYEWPTSTYKKQAPIHQASSSNDENELIVFDDSPDARYENIENIERNEYNIEHGIIFRVQIMAMRRQASKKELIGIYTGEQEIFEKYEDGWYKYSIGSFKSYEAAKSFCTADGIEGSFITVYKNGKRIAVEDALRNFD